MKWRKSSSDTTAGSIITPLIARRTSSSAMTLFGFVMASVSRLLQKAIGTTRWAVMRACGSSETTRGSILILARLTKSTPTWLVGLDEAFGEHAHHRGGQRRMRGEHALELGLLEHGALGGLERQRPTRRAACP